MYQLQKVRIMWGDFWDMVPRFYKGVLAVHLLTCTYALSVLYDYHYTVYGGTGAFLMTVLAAVAFGVTTVTGILSLRTAHLESAEMMDRQVRSRAILNTLYPARVLEQMYSELTEDQICEAQEQIQEQLNPPMSDESILLLEEAQEERKERKRLQRQQSFQNLSLIHI